MQAVLHGHNRPKYSKREIAFRGLMQCAYDGCMVTGEVQKAKVRLLPMHRASRQVRPSTLPRGNLAQRLGEPLKGLQVPEEVVSQIVATLRDDQKQSANKVSAERSRLEGRLTSIRNRMDGAYADKLDGKIPETSGNAR